MIDRDGTLGLGVGPMNLVTMIKQPSAFLPLVMSGAALGTVLVHIALFGAAREAD